MPAPQGTAARLLEVARKEIGIIEGPKENQTKYGAFTKANFQPWCGSFVMWCANQAGVKVPNTVYTPGGAAGFKKLKSWHDAAVAKPAAGDIVFFDFPGDGVDRISHVGIVVKDNGDGTVNTIEGNTSGSSGDQRNGGMVLRKVRAYKKNSKGVDVSIVGFGRPKFVGPAAAAPVKVEKVIDPAAYPDDPIQPGEIGEYVKVLQKAMGLTGKAVDGQYGPVTKKAIAAWQKSKGLTADAVVDKAQFAMLKKLADAPAPAPLVAKPVVAPAAKVAKAKPAAPNYPIKGGKITTPYGKKGKMWSKGYHTGVDFAVPVGTEVLAIADGVIENASWGSAYGTQLVHKTAAGWVIYAHLSKALVKPGQKVKKGQVIGKSGNTGNSSGPHLHFELRSNIRWSAGKDIDPKKLF